MKARLFMARDLVSMSKAARHQQEQHRAIEKPKLDDARTLRGMNSIDLDDKEFKDTMKNA